MTLGVLFTTFTFVFFLILVVGVRWALPSGLVVPWLLACSWAFYAACNPPYLLLLLGATAFSFALGRALEATRRKKTVLTVSLVGSLGLLGYFKYAGFFAEQVSELSLALGGDALPQPDIVLPLGISFFTFQMVSYLVDVYRGAPSERSFVHYAAYIAFFPQLVAGPIVRASELLPQLQSRPSFTGKAVVTGLDLLALGFVKKLVFADNLGRFSDSVFARPEGFEPMAVWVGVLCYAGQIYCDFSAYTDIARGAGKLLGYELPENFDLPYLSRSITEFWRRWHITLSRWLRDYLYIPLGGNRHGRLPQYRNLVITMALGGLWHGASWSFVLWGLAHGLLLLLHKAWGGALDRLGLPADGRARGSLPYAALSCALTFTLVCALWVLFRAETLDDAVAVLSAMAQVGDLRLPDPLPQPMKTPLVLLALLLAAHLFRIGKRVDRLYPRLPAPAHGVGWAAAVAACYFFAKAGRTFIYFQF